MLGTVCKKTFVNLNLVDKRGVDASGATKDTLEVEDGCFILKEHRK